MSARGAAAKRFARRAPAGLAALVLAAAFQAGTAAERDVDRDRDWEICRSVSFDPLRDTVPACSRLIDSGGLEPAALIEALSQRVGAYIVALTYKYDDSITNAELWQRALADTERAVILARDLDPPDTATLEEALHDRGDARWMTGDLAGAVEDFSEALATSGDSAAFLLGSRARVHAAMGRYDEAIADMSAAIRIAPVTGRSNLHNWIFQRGELHEAAGDVDAAIADYRRTLETDPEHIAAGRALKRLGVAPTD